MPERHFIVGRYGSGAIIREVDPSSCAHTLSRTEAWERATNISAARRKMVPPKPAGEIHFIDLEMNQTLIKEQ